jgi:hypothetical protein
MRWTCGSHGGGPIRTKGTARGDRLEHCLLGLAPGGPMPGAPGRPLPVPQPLWREVRAAAEDQPGPIDRLTSARYWVLLPARQGPDPPALVGSRSNSHDYFRILLPVICCQSSWQKGLDLRTQGFWVSALSFLRAVSARRGDPLSSRPRNRRIALPGHVSGVGPSFSVAAGPAVPRQEVLA